MEPSNEQATQSISADMPYAKQFSSVHGKQIAYVEVGSGDPIVLLHGNPTSSYLWRNVVPSLEKLGRVIVPDLIGQGDSDKLNLSETEQYGFSTAYRYLSGLLDQLKVQSNVVLVVHDWGSALGFHWAKEHSDAVKGIAYMEGITMPLSWDDWPEGARGIFQGFRSDKGEDLILNRNMFIEAVLPSSVIRDLSDEEMTHYRAPFMDEASRQVTLNWPREIPINGEPKAMVALVKAYGEWLETSDSLPKLFINAEPGSILVGKARDYCRTWPNQQEVTVKGLHFIQEDSPHEIGHAIATWMTNLGN